MKPSPNYSTRSGGFSLVELLTVIAIIGILATLLMTAVTSSKERARQIACTSNLRQISLAMNMYLDDLEKRPTDLEALASARYILNQNSFLCPDDRTKRWGVLVNQQLASFQNDLASDRTTPPTGPSPSVQPMPYSYLHPLFWPSDAWDRLMQAGTGAGFATCELHGLGKPNLISPSIYDFQGLILRAQRDGAVVRRQNFWPKLSPTDFNPSGATPGAASGGPQPATLDYPWSLFIDSVPPAQ